MAANDLLNRYLFAVSRYLPASRQGDLLSELAANLSAQMEDKAAALGHPLTASEQADVLRQHGHPIVVAARYQPRRYLIGPELFPFYLFAIKRVLPWVIGIWLLAAAVTTIWGTPAGSIAQHIDIGHIVSGLFSTVFLFLAWMTAGFAALEYFKGYCGKGLMHPDWDPHKLPKVQPPVQDGPRHPIGDVIAGVAFTAWLLLFPHYPVLVFGPYMAMRVFDLNIDLPAVWHTFYWIIVAFNLIQLGFRIALLSRPTRRYYHLFESVLHVLGIGILVFLLSARDYIGQATFGGKLISPENVPSLNANIHRALLVVLIIAVVKFIWDTVQLFRPHGTAHVPART